MIAQQNRFAVVGLVFAAKTTTPSSESSESKDKPAGRTAEKIKLAINDFGVFGYNDAPTGKTFGESAINLKPQYQGEKHGAIRKAIEDAITLVEQGRQRPAEAFAQGVKDAARAAR